MAQVILLLSAPDKRGIAASVMNFIYDNNGNVIDADQHYDEESNIFFMRVAWSLEGFKLNRDQIENTFKPIADQFKMNWEHYFDDEPLRAAIFVSKPLHCIYDLLYRYKAGHLKCGIPLIISNHKDAEEVALDFGSAFHHFTIDQKNKDGEEKKQIDLLEKEKIDLVILARYHQILSKEFCQMYPERIINIHHSFLPAFAGKSPYTQAYQKGVKIIGATSHYVTEKLDEGPIIEQDTVRVSHRDTIDDLKR